MKDDMTFEQAMRRLEEVTELLGNSETTLDRSLQLFSEATELIGFCEDKLSHAQLTIEKMAVTSNREATEGES